MDRYKETFSTWNKVASQYQDKFMNLDLYNNTYDFICNSLSKDEARLLEVGCGPGNITRYLLSKRPDFKIFGIDIAAIAGCIFTFADALYKQTNPPIQTLPLICK